MTLLTANAFPIALELIEWSSSIMFAILSLTLGLLRYFPKPISCLEALNYPLVINSRWRFSNIRWTSWFLCGNCSLCILWATSPFSCAVPHIVHASKFLMQQCMLVDMMTEMKYSISEEFLFFTQHLSAFSIDSPWYFYTNVPSTFFYIFAA